MREKIQNDVVACELREKEFKKTIEQKWNCRLKKLAIDYRFDYVVLKEGKIKAFLEIKKRNLTTDKYDDSMINLNKWMKAKQLRDSTKLPTILACRYIDKDIYCMLTDNTKHELRWGARTKNTRDWQDVQPAVHIMMTEFKELI